MRELDVVDVDDAVMRSQHRITGGMPVDHHLAVIDVREGGPRGALVVHPTGITPDSLADLSAPAIEAGVHGSETHLESSG